MRVSLPSLVVLLLCLMSSAHFLLLLLLLLSRVVGVVLDVVARPHGSGCEKPSVFIRAAEDHDGGTSLSGNPEKNTNTKTNTDNDEDKTPTAREWRGAETKTLAKLLELEEKYSEMMSTFERAKTRRVYQSSIESGTSIGKRRENITRNWKERRRCCSREKTVVVIVVTTIPDADNNENRRQRPGHSRTVFQSPSEKGGRRADCFCGR